MLTYWSLQSGVAGDSFEEILASTLDGVAIQLE